MAVFNHFRCWLKGLAFHFAFLAPVGLILLFNFVIFGLVMYRFFKISVSALNEKGSFTLKKQLRGAIGMIILLGLTWVFAIFAIDKASLAFNYMFAIFNSLQVLHTNLLYACFFFIKDLKMSGCVYISHYKYKCFMVMIEA